ncbi:MAG: hypothetical protein V3U57_00305 [Robiginitomaculum sp.]
MKKSEPKKSLKYTLTARNEAVKALAGWFRTISLGLMAVALVEPLRNPANFNVIATGIATIGSFLTLGVSMLIYAWVKEPEK